MKVTVTFEGDDQGPKTSLKLDLPTKWLDGPLSKLIDTFVTNYNKKNSSAPLADVHLVNEQRQYITPETIIGEAATNGDEFFVIRGKPNPNAHVKAVKKEDEKSDEEEDVTTKAGIEKAKQKAQFAFDYSKWDKLDLSDDDAADCHPNIELNTWKRIKAQQRAERRAKEEAEIQRLQDKIARYETRAKELEDGSDENARKEALAMAEKYKAKLEDFMEHRKWVADEVCEVKESRSIVNKVEAPIPPPNVKPDTKKSDSIGPAVDKEFENYDEYIQRYEPLLRKFVSIENDREATEKFMVEHPEILNQHADGFLLLLCLDTAMRQQEVPAEKKTPKQIEAENRELRRVVRQHLMLNYVLELAKLSKVDDVRAAVKPFFLKTSKQTKEQQAEFEKELVAFIGRIEARAREKLGKGEKSPLAKKVVAEEEDEEEYEKAGLGPGGLDPTEVLQTLPEEMQEAFIAQDVDKLKQVMANLPPAEADYHLQRCIDSGLWVVPPKAKEEESESDEEEDGESGSGAVAAGAN